jgi:chromosome partitioning protein
MYEELIRERDKNGWDNKDWARATGFNQAVLEAIEEGDLDLSEEQQEIILSETKKWAGRKTNLLRFVSPVVVAVSTQKGGIGKTTIATNLAYELSAMGYNVLLVDTDSQMDSTKTFIEEDNIEKTLNYNFYECVTSRSDLTEAIFSTKYERLDIVPANIKLSKVETFISAMSFKEQIVSDCLKNIMKKNYYDFIIFDTDKNIGQLNTTILNASRYLLMVSECASYSIDGLETMKQQYLLVKEKTNPELEIIGVVLNKVNMRKEIVKKSKDIINEMFPNGCFKNIIKNDATIEKAQWNNTSISDYQKSSNAAKQFRSFTREFLERVEETYCYF